MGLKILWEKMSFSWWQSVHRLSLQTSEAQGPWFAVYDVRHFTETRETSVASLHLTDEEIQA